MQCKNCGSTEFKDNKCIYCGSKIDISMKEWMINNLKEKTIYGNEEDKKFINIFKDCLGIRRKRK